MNGTTWLHTREGQVPLVVTAAHAGARRLAGIAQDDGGTLRDDPGNVGCRYNDSLVDTRTDLVLEALFASLDWRGLRPYGVLPDVSRRDLDLNRRWDHNRIGYQNGGVSASTVSVAGAIYDAYYEALETFIADANGRFANLPGPVVVVDVHGTGLPSGTTVALGTRNGASAGAARVYGDTNWALSLHRAIEDVGFAVSPVPGGSESPLGGCHVLRANGTTGLGADAIQLELDTSLRSASEAVRTGHRLANALRAFLRNNSYPAIEEEHPMSPDDEAYAALSL
ncbi:MAG: hypothetical protein AAF500_12195 [Myxococcota bacterium]